MAHARVPEANQAAQRQLFGPLDKNLRLLREQYGVRISARHDVLTVEGDDEEAVEEVARRVRRLLSRMRPGAELAAEEIEGVLLGKREIDRARPGGGRPRNREARDLREPRPFMAGPMASRVGDPRPLTEMQERYIEAIRRRDIVFAIGPAGTGKTFLAVVEAVAALRSGTVRRIVLTRPAVEAGEKLGFLPGDFQAKINPYLRPLYDALGELLPYGEVQRYLVSDIIEIVPLAYMRGRTLKGAFIILDEAQNTTPAQMKMFLTRMGDGSKVVVTGDVTQVDLPDGSPSGLVESARILRNVDEIAVIRFQPSDILRHPLVQQIVDAYEVEDQRRAGAGPEGMRPPSTST